LRNKTIGLCYLYPVQGNPRNVLKLLQNGLSSERTTKKTRKEDQKRQLYQDFVTRVFLSVIISGLTGQVRVSTKMLPRTAGGSFRKIQIFISQITDFTKYRFSFRFVSQITVSRRQVNDCNICTMENLPMDAWSNYFYD